MAKGKPTKAKGSAAVVPIVLTLIGLLVAVFVGLALVAGDEERLTALSLPSDEKYVKVLDHEKLRNNILKKRLSPREQEEKEEGFRKNQFNQFISDRLPLSRYFYDTREVACLNKKYTPLKKMPTVSVIIIFYNEARSTLLRTARSVLDRTPPNLLKEILLVDDGSSHEHLKGPLDKDIAKFEKTRVIRLQERVGLIRAKVYGAEEADGDVLMYMDSHCECVDGWLEPLLDRIVKDRTTVAMPVIDAIEENTWEFRTSIMQRGVFSWHLEFYWLDITPAEAAKRKSVTDPLVTPAMAGGIFAIDRKYFFEIGAYDMGMDTWGGENFEMSFRIWMCGGKLEIIPCARVGHVFRAKSPYTFKKDPEETIAHNLNRVAAVWMDDYAPIYFNLTGNLKWNVSDVSERVELRKKLQCHDFKWYVDNVISDTFIPFPSNAHEHGYVRNIASNGCLAQNSVGEEARFLKIVGAALQECGTSDPLTIPELFLTKTPNSGQLRNEDSHGARCLLPEDTRAGAALQWVHCHDHESDNSLVWLHNSDGQLVHEASGLCLSQSTAIPVVEECEHDEAQIWEFTMDVQSADPNVGETVAADETVEPAGETVAPTDDAVAVAGETVPTAEETTTV